MSEITLRIRQVRPGFWQDQEILALRLDHRLAYIGLWAVADDAGFFPWKPREIAYHLGIPVRTIVAACEAIASLPGQSRFLIADCGVHASVPNLRDHQRFAKSTNRVIRHEMEHQRECLAPAPPIPLASPSQPPPIPLPVGEVRSSGVGVEEMSSDDPPTDLPPDIADRLRAHGRLPETPPAAAEEGATP